MRLRWNLSTFLPAKARSYLMLVPVCAVAGAGIALHRSSGLPSTYASTGRVVVSGRLNFSEGNPVANDFMSVLGTQLEILTSEELRERSMIKLKLERPEAAVRPDLAARMVPRTTIFELTATSGSSTHVQRYLDLVMEEYIAMRREQRLVSSRSVMDQISGEIARLEKSLNEQEAELFRFKQQRNIVFWEQQSTTAARFLSQLKNREASLRMQLKLAELLDRGADREALAQRTGSLEIGDAAGSARVRPPAPAGTAAGGLAAQKIRLRELEIEREALAKIFLPKHPKYRRAEEEIEKLRRLVRLLEQEDASAYRAEVDAMRSELDTILTSMGEWERKVLESSQIEAEHQKLQGSLTRTRELYQRLVGSLQSIDFRKGVDDEVIQILKRAGVAAENKPDAAVPVRNGAVLGLLVGVIATALAVRMDRRAFAVAEVAGGLGLEVAVEVPLLRRRIKEGVALANPKCPGGFAEAIRSLRASLALGERSGPGGLVVVICSSTPGEGKSTLSLNLAHAAAGAGLRTLLIDADLRRGTIGQRLGIPLETGGLADYLRDNSDWRRHVVTAPGMDFSVMTCGTNPAALIDRLMFKLPPALTVEAKAEYEMVIIDSAPIIPVSDTIPFLSRVDRVVFVVRLRNAMITTAAKALQVLKRSSGRDPLLVVNGVRGSDGHDYYDYSSYRYYGNRG